MEEKVEDQPDGHVLGLWEETGRHPHPEDVESPPRNSQNRESNPQPEDQSCPKTQTSRKTPVFISVWLLKKSPVFVLQREVKGGCSHRTEKASWMRWRNLEQVRWSRSWMTEASQGNSKDLKSQLLISV